MMMAFTGHRPEKLPWGTDEKDLRCQALKLQIRQRLESAAENGIRCFACGMARGCDFYFAEAVLDLKKIFCDVELDAYIPCRSQPDRWSQPDRERYHRILSGCSRIHLLQNDYTKGCMLRRNQVMIDECDQLMSVWDGTAGGTASAAAYGKKQGKEIISLWL